MGHPIRDIVPIDPDSEAGRAAARAITATVLQIEQQIAERELLEQLQADAAPLERAA